jgi:ribose transport system permease protein
MTRAVFSIAQDLVRYPVSPQMRQLGYRGLAVALLCLMLALLSDAFATASNLLNVLRQTSLLFLMASGLTLVVISGGLDLSIGANVALSACLGGTVMKATSWPLAGALVGIGTGAIIGLSNGLMVSLLRIPSFIASYGMLWVLHGLAYAYMAGEAVYGFPHSFRQVGTGFLLGVPMPVFVMAGFLLLGWGFMQRTVWGQEIYAIGSNSQAARLSGVPVRQRLLLVYVLSGAMAGLASLVFLARLNSAEADIGDSLLLPAIAAVLVGGASLLGGEGTLFGTFVGALLLTLVLNGMNLLTIDARWQPLVTGVIVIAVVWLNLGLRRNAGMLA